MVFLHAKFLFTQFFFSIYLSNQNCYKLLGNSQFWNWFMRHLWVQAGGVKSTLVCTNFLHQIDCRLDWDRWHHHLVNWPAWFPVMGNYHLSRSNHVWGLEEITWILHVGLDSNSAKYKLIFHHGVNFRLYINANFAGTRFWRE